MAQHKGGCCVTVDYAYPEYGDSARSLRDRYFKGSWVYKPLETGYHRVANFLLKRAENNNFWRFIVKNIVAGTIVKFVINEKKPKVAVYFPQALLLLIIFVILGLSFPYKNEI